MTHTYKISGMTCTGCSTRVTGLLETVPAVTGVQIDLQAGTAAITMSRPVETAQLQAALSSHPQYHLAEEAETRREPEAPREGRQPWLSAYKPLLLVFAYILAISLAVEAAAGGFQPERWMNNFMAGFFLVFSFFKMLDLKGFAESYASYDLAARRWTGWGYVYAFAELGLGIAYLLRLAPLAVNGIAFLLMSLSLAGVLRSVLQKQKIRCACLGTVFNLPMSTVTIIEDALMILMSGIMCLHLL